MATIPSAQTMIDDASIRYPEMRFAVSKGGGSIAVLRGDKWECVSMLAMGIGWLPVSSNAVPQSDWVEVAPTGGSLARVG